jgi:tetratricopeptide (TPR) repeat protein
MHNRLNKELLIIIFILFVSLIVRFVYLWQSSSNPSFTAPTVDSGTYDQMARQLAKGEGMNYEFFWQSFFYPGFLSIVYFFSNSSIVCARAVQAILGGLTCVLTYILGKKIFNRKVGLLAAFVTSLYGPLIFFETELLSSSWEAFWAVILILLFLKTASEKKLWLWMLLGICGALSVLTRPTFVPFFAVGCLWLLIVLYRTKGTLRELAIRFIGLAAGFLLIAIPIALQNQKITGRFGILPAAGGINLYIGNNPDYSGTIIIRPGWGWEELTTLPERNGITGDLWVQQKYFYDKVKDFIRTQPLKYIKGLAYKAVQFLSSRELPRNDDLYLFGRWAPLFRVLTWKVAGFGFPFGVLLPLATVGIVCYWKQTPVIVKLFLILYPLSIILVFVTARYKVVVVPIMSILAAAGLFGLIEIVKRRRWFRLGAAAICTAGLILLSSVPGPFPEEKINYEAELYANVGAAETLQGKYEQAIIDLKKSLQMVPDNGMAHANLASALSKQNKNEEAIKHCQEALRLKPNSPEVLNNMGAMLVSLGKIDEALKYFHRSIEMNPYQANAYFNLGNALFRKGEDEAAIKSYTKAISLNPKYAKAYLNRGLTYYQIKQFTAAEENCLKALQIDPRNTRAYLTLGHANFKLGKMDEATRYYAKALEVDNNFVEARPNLAWMYNYKAKELLKQEKTAEAVTYLQKAIDVYPIDIQNHILLAEVLAKQGQYDQAVGVLKKAIGYMTMIGDKEAVDKLQKALSDIELNQNHNKAVK